MRKRYDQSYICLIYNIRQGFPSKSAGLDGCRLAVIKCNCVTFQGLLLASIRDQWGIPRLMPHIAAYLMSESKFNINLFEVWFRLMNAIKCTWLFVFPMVGCIAFEIEIISFAKMYVFHTKKFFAYRVLIGCLWLWTVYITVY